jgi:hypothetical protein
MVPSHQDSIDNDTSELVVDLRDYITMSDSDDDTHISSSQKTSDECRDLLPPPPPPSSQPQNSGLGFTNRPQFAPAHTSSQPVDEGDLPTWMLTKAQWKYITSTAGGPAWEGLLKVYMQQERRLEFTDMVSNLTRTSSTLALNRS